MVRYLEFEHIFKHPFEKVIRAYFQKVSAGSVIDGNCFRRVEISLISLGMVNN